MKRRVAVLFGGRSAEHEISCISARAVVDSVGSKLVRLLPRRSQLIPSPLAGSISGLRAGETLAFALNGRIAAVTHVYRERGTGGALRFSALVQESAFKPGRNSVRAFAVSGPASSPQLRELALRLSH